MVMEAYVAHRKRLLPLKELQDISGYVLSIFGKIEIPAEDALINLMKQDKKNRGNRILMAVPKKIGRAVWDVQVNEKEIRDAVDYYQARQT